MAGLSLDACGCHRVSMSLSACVMMESLSAHHYFLQQNPLETRFSVLVKCRISRMCENE